jgi:hypothetical protein
MEKVFILRFFYLFKFHRHGVMVNVISFRRPPARTAKAPEGWRSPRRSAPRVGRRQPRQRLGLRGGAVAKIFPEFSFELD